MVKHVATTLKEGTRLRKWQYTRIHVKSRDDDQTSAYISRRVLITSTPDEGGFLNSFSAFTLSTQSRYEFHYFVCNMQCVHAMHVVFHYAHYDL